MARTINPREKIMQRTIGFPFRQHEFFAKYQDFKPDKFCREAIDEQIRYRDKKFLSEEEREKMKREKNEAQTN